MSLHQTVALLVLIAVIAALIHGKARPDVVALTGAAILLMTGVIRPVEVQAAFASPAIIALASLFVIAYAMERSGLLDKVIQAGVEMCGRLGLMGLWLLIGACGAASSFLNNTPIVVLAAPVVRDVAKSMGQSPRRFLIPLSYVSIMGGACTLIGTSTNLLVNDMARTTGQASFGLFEITPVGLIIAIVGGLYLLVFGGPLLGAKEPEPGDQEVYGPMPAPHDVSLGDSSLFEEHRRLRPWHASLSLAVFLGVVFFAAVGWAPIAAAAFAGAVLLIITRVISAEEAYRGLRPDILLLIAGMVVIGLSLEVSGLATAATEGMIEWIRPLGPLTAMILLYGATLFLTEILSNAAVAVLLTPVAVALAESLGVSPRPFLVAVMMAASAAFATPFGYQTNVLVYQMGRYSYLDFVRIGLPLNMLTWLVGAMIIPLFFPF
ncbi:MAG: SLC13/DASS family transporter [Caulobacter sp.]|nr:SLC13/DASS family transporter [Caulobacter sp.]